MTVLTFPTSPTLGQQYAAPNGIQYVFDGVKWIVETTSSSSEAVSNSTQDRVAPMFVNGDNTGITFTYNAATNVMNASITALNGNQLVNGVHEFTLESNGTLSLDGDPFVITSDSLVNSASSFSVSSDGTLTLTHPPESDPIVHPLSTVLTVQKAAGNYHTISGAYGLSLQATPVPGGYGLNTNTNFVDIFHDGISVNVNDNTWGFGTDGTITFPTGGQIANYPDGVGASDNSWFVTPGGEDGNGGVSSQDGQQYIQINNNLSVEIGTSYGTANESIWRFGRDGDLTLPAGGDILDSNGDSVLGGGATSYAPDDTDNWNDPTINTISAALDELAARVTALQNYEIDGGNANTPELGELLIDGNGA